MGTISEEQKTVKVERVFEGLEAHEDGQRMSIFYDEITSIDGEVIRSERKSYLRDFQFWKASQLGQAILGMVALDLEQPDPTIPRA